MKFDEPALKDAIKHFELLLKKTPDTPNNVITFRIFLRQLLRVKTKHVNLPAAEIIAILKNEKPHIFRALKMQSDDISYLNYLTNINMNYDEANKKLSSIKELIK